MSTREGFSFRPKDGTLKSGLKCSAVVSPRTNIPSPVWDVFDVIIIGAGYAGLTACRDLCLSGYKILLLESRDRIGGRTYTAEVDGHLYEMGGTWIHWNQPHLYREMSRYRTLEMVDSNDSGGAGCNYFTTVSGKTVSTLSHDDADRAIHKAFELLCDVDGKAGRAVIPYPHNPLFNPAAKKWERMSVAERLDEINGKLSSTEMSILQAYIAAITGNDMQSSGFFDVLRWWALCGYSAAGIYEGTEGFKIAMGQSNFARQFFEEALSTGNLRYAFDTHVDRVQNQEDRVLLRSKTGQTWAGKKLICTVPLNILREVHFEPPLSAGKIAASRRGHINFAAKVHMETEGGNTHLVFFGSNRDFSNPKDDVCDFLSDAQRVQEMEVKHVVWHNWLTDPLSRGTWCNFAPDYSFKYLEDLRKYQGNVLFASGDWALGWRGFIDGAIEEGTRAAKGIMDDLRPEKPIPSAL
ncbi:hypothetical protein CcaCcLH18_03374 [Colletotrichum camelliae]|nr:hypothetical protein CcaCcLH18_03374 [Colletotrichum camelliae]